MGSISSAGTNLTTPISLDVRLGNSAKSASSRTTIAPSSVSNPLAISS